MSQRRNEHPGVPRISLKSILPKKQSNSPSDETMARSPVEIVENIFIQAALDPSLSPLTAILMRVSRWVNDLVRPYFYRSVHLKNYISAECFLYTISHNPELRRSIVHLNAAEIPRPDIIYRSWERERKEEGESRAWRLLCGKKSPDVHALAKIVVILLDSKVEKKIKNQNSTQTAFGSPTVSALESITIDSQYFVFSPWNGNGFRAYPMIMAPPVVTITSVSSLLIRYGVWDFTRVKKLRLASAEMHTVSSIPDFSSLPQLTHLALPLTEGVTDTARMVLASPRIERLAIFTCYGPNSSIIPRRIRAISNPSETISHSRETLLPPHQLWTDAENLGSIADSRLFLFDFKEMKRTYEMPNEEFWDAIEHL